MSEIGRYRIWLDKEWLLEDFYRFPRAYEQVYFFFTSIDHERGTTDRIHHAYEAYPWQGGYSAVGFFDELRYATPRPARPRIIAIQKSSPGFLDLGLFVGIATALGVSVKKIAISIDVANTTYNNIYKGMQERRLLKLRVDLKQMEFDREQLSFIKESPHQMAAL